MILFIAVVPLSAQTVIVTDDPTYTTGQASAVLDVKSISKGFLIPRLTQAQRTAITSPAQGLLVFQTDGTSGFYYYTGSAWAMLASGGATWSLTGNAGTSYATNFLGTTDNTSMRFRTNNTQRMIMDSLGNVGIGTSPGFTTGTFQEKFLVDAGATSSFNAMVARGTINNYFQLNIQNKSSGNTASSDVVATADNGTETVNYVDLGINSSGNTQNVFGNPDDAYLYTTGNNFLIGTATAGKALVFMTAGTTQSTNERMRIDSLGKVGIGTTTPATALHVVGTNPLTLNGVQTGTSTSADSLLTITSGLVRKLPISTFQTAISFTAGSIPFIGTGGAWRQNNASLFWDSTNNRLGIGTNGPASDFTLLQGTGGVNSRGMRFTGNAIGGANTGSGFSIILGNNVANNKQLWLGDPDYLGNSAATFVRFTSTNGITGLDGVAGDNSTRKPIGIGWGADPNAPVLLGSDGSATLPGSYIWANGNMAIGNGYRSNAAPSNGLIVQGNVGIGTTTPATALHVVGTNPLTLYGVQAGATTDSILTITAGTVRKLPYTTVTSGSSWSLTGNTGTNYATNFLGTTDNTSMRLRTNNAQGMILDSLGNLGIGSAPGWTTGAFQEKFLVDAGTTSSFNAMVARGTINNYFQLNIQNKSSGNTASSDVVATADNGTETVNYVDLGINGSGNSQNVFGNPDDAYLYTTGNNFLIGTATAAQSLVFMTGGTTQSTNERMRINGSGNVGIGTTTPATALHVVGTNPLTLYGVQTGAATDSILTITAGTVRKLPFSTVTSNTSWSLTGNTGTNYATNFLGTTDNTSLRIRTNNNPVMIVDSLGNVGIGTTTATSNLTLYQNASGATSSKGFRFTGSSLGGPNSGTGFAMTLGFNIVNNKQLWLGDADYLGLTSGTFIRYSTSNGFSIIDAISGDNSVRRPLSLGYGADPNSAVILGADLSSTVPGSYIWANGNMAIGNGYRSNAAPSNGLLVQGNVGIGTTTPATALHVVGTNPLTLYGVQTGAATDSILTITAGTVRKLPFSTVTSNTSWSLTGNTGTNFATNFLGTTDNTSMRFRTNNTQRLILDSLGNVGIGASPGFTTGTFQEKLLIDAGTTSSFNAIVARGTINNYFQLNIQNKSNGNTASSDVVATADNGTESINYVDLGINGSANSQNVFGNPDDAYLYTTGNNFLIGTATAGKALVFMTAGTTQSTNERMRIDSLGNVGIGTTSPASALHVVGTNPLTLYGVQAGATTDSILTITAGTVRKLPFSTVTGNGSWSLTGNTGTNFATNFLGTTDNTSMRFRTDNTQRLILDSLGNVGIGTSPGFTTGTFQEKLLIDAGTTSSFNAIVARGTINNYFQLNIQNKSNGNTASSDVVATADNGTESVNYVDLGINGSANSQNVFGNPDDAYLYTTGNNFLIGNATPGEALVFMTGGTTQSTNERMRIDGSGNVGIGKTTLAYKVDVHGRGNFDSTLNAPAYTSTFQTLTFGTTITWDQTKGATAAVTLTGNATLAISNVVAGMYGLIRVTQDASGSRTLTLPSGSKVINSGGGIATLTPAANATDVLSYFYDGTNYYWTIGYNYN